MAEFHCAGEIDWGAFVGHIDGLDRPGGFSPERGRQHKRQYGQLRGGAEQCQWMSSDLTTGADRAPTLPIPESISYRLCAEFAASFRQASHSVQAAEGLFGSVFCRPKARLFPVNIQRVSVGAGAADKRLRGD
jgi:hypothetical protein